MKVARFLIVLGIAVSIGLLAGCQAKPTPTTANGPTPQQIADSLARIAKIERGHQAFTSYCAMCHGDGGNGDGDVAPAILHKSGVKVARLNDRDQMSRLTEPQIREVIAKGGGHTGRSNLMPSWGEKLDPQVIGDIATFVVSLADSNPAIPLATLQHYLEAPPGVPADGRVLFLHHCSACHGAYGKGDGSFGEQLWKTHQIRPRNLTDSVYIASKTDQQLYATIALGGGHFRKSVQMPAWTVTLNPAQIKSVVAYVREISHSAAKP
jgi:mono/diheme cytochrome c family protein